MEDEVTRAIERRDGIRADIVQARAGPFGGGGGPGGGPPGGYGALFAKLAKAEAALKAAQNKMKTMVMTVTVKGQ